MDTAISVSGIGNASERLARYLEISSGLGLTIFKLLGIMGVSTIVFTVSRIKLRNKIRKP